MQAKRTIKTVPVEKRDIDILTPTEITALTKFSQTTAYTVLLKLAENTKLNIAKEIMSLDISSPAEISSFNENKGMARGVDFIMDSCNRAKELQKEKAKKTKKAK